MWVVKLHARAGLPLEKHPSTPWDGEGEGGSYLVWTLWWREGPLARTERWILGRAAPTQSVYQVAILTCQNF